MFEGLQKCVVAHEGALLAFHARGFKQSFHLPFGQSAVVVGLCNAHVAVQAEVVVIEGGPAEVTEVWVLEVVLEGRHCGLQWWWVVAAPRPLSPVRSIATQLKDFFHNNTSCSTTTLLQQRFFSYNTSIKIQVKLIFKNTSKLLVNCPSNSFRLEATYRLLETFQRLQCFPILLEYASTAYCVLRLPVCKVWWACVHCIVCNLSQHSLERSVQESIQQISVRSHFKRPAYMNCLY